MGLHGVAQFINGVDGRVAGGVKADGVVGAGNIVINGACDADAGHAQPGQLLCAAERAVAAAADQAVNAQKTAVVCRTLAVLRVKHLLAAGGIKHGAALHEQTVHIPGGQHAEIVADQSGVTVENAKYFNVIGDAHAGNGADDRIHAGGIAAAGQNADAANFLLFSHRKNLLIVEGSH